MQAHIIYKESGKFPDENTGEIIQYAKIQVYDPAMRISQAGRVGSPAFFLRGDYIAISSIPDDKIGGKFEIQTIRVPKKDTIEERVVGVKHLG